MKLQLFLALALLLTTFAVRAQTPHCNCIANLDSTIQKTEENYAGYPAKASKTTAATYARFVQTLQQKASNETNPKRCYYIIREYVKYFKDKHFIITYNNTSDFDSTVVPYTEMKFKKDLLKKHPTPIEGIWTNPDSTTKIAIQKSKDGTFKALKLASVADNYPVGFVYFTLMPKGAQYIVKEYNSFVSTDFPAKQTGGLLQLWNHALWGKVFPQEMTKQEAAELSSWKHNNNGLLFKKLTPQVACLKIPTFYNNDNKIQQLVASSDSIIRSTRYLIVDLRGNGGGNTGWIYLLPYFMTNPIIQEPSLLRVTPDNVKRKLPDLEPFVKSPISSEYKKYFPDSVLNAYKEAYDELPTTKATFYPVPAVLFPLDSITKKPEKIALVVDNFCGSSTEYFVYLTRQSTKTTTYGTNTIGMMDYEGMSTPTALPFEKFILTIPIAKSSWTDRKPIDQTGFKPDMLIHLPENRWMDFIVDDLQKR